MARLVSEKRRRVWRNKPGTVSDKSESESAPGQRERTMRRKQNCSVAGEGVGNMCVSAWKAIDGDKSEKGGKMSMRDGIMRTAGGRDDEKHLGEI